MTARARFHVPELDGLRGVAILLVLACHFSGAVMSESHRTHPLLYIWRLGWCGVDLFFILSGFLITSILISARDEPTYFSSFYWRRALRIFPLYFVFLAVFFAIQKVGIKDSIWYWFYLSNWHDAFVPGVPLIGHFWSLSVEEQFYLFWPLAIYVTPVRRLWVLILGVCLAGFGLSFAYELAGLGEVGLLTLTPFRMGALALGGMLAINRNRLKSVLPLVQPFSLGSLIGLLWLWAELKDRIPPFATLTYVLTAIAFAGMVARCCAFSGGDELPAKLSRQPILRSFGKYSYAMYVLHPVIMGLASHRLWGALSRRLSFGIGAASYISIMIGLSYLSGILSWYLIERHFLALKDHSPNLRVSLLGKRCAITAVDLDTKG